MASLRKYQPIDSKVIAELTSAIWSLDFTLNSRMIQISLEDFERLYLLKIEEELIGYALVVQKEAGIWLEFLDIRCAYQCQGYGSLILKEVLRDYPELYVHSIMDSDRFYTKNGFRILDDEHDLIMVVTERYDNLFEKWHDELRT